MPPEPPVLFAHWERFTGWLLDRTEKFPKRVAFTFRTRIDNLALDVYERLIEVRYQRDRNRLLGRINLNLEKLRLLLRLAHAQRRQERARGQPQQERARQPQPERGVSSCELSTRAEPVRLIGEQGAWPEAPGPRIAAPAPRF